MRSNLVDLTLILVCETSMAFGLKQTEDQEELVWLTKSMTEVERIGKSRVVVVTVPESIAHDKGLI